MKLGIFTAAFPGKSLDEVAAWTAENGFETLEIACWPLEKASRRYAGVNGYYPNPMYADPEHREKVIDHLKKVFLAAELLEVDIVGTFVGRDKDKNIPDNLEAFAEIWPPIVKYAADHQVKIAIENCPMIFSYDEWPGGNNLASSPALWKKMWEIIPDDNFGLNLDPSHLILQMIDYERVVFDFKDKIFHVHAKDLEIDREGLYQNGVLSQGMGWQVPRLPGLGDIDWGNFISALYRVGYDYVISIEHEDRAFEETEDLVKRGFLIARDVLRPYIK